MSLALGIEWWLTQNVHGLWCNICGECLAVPRDIDETFQAPECCKNCGAPDEIDPEAI